MDLHRLSARLSVYFRLIVISENFRERLRLSFKELLEHHRRSGSMVACCRFTVTVNRLSVAGLQMEIDSLLKLCRSFPSPPHPRPPFTLSAKQRECFEHPILPPSSTRTDLTRVQFSSVGSVQFSWLRSVQFRLDLFEISF